MDTDSPAKRKRARLACQPCRERKRKCDGSDPCKTCRDWGYDCLYAQQSRKKSRVSQQSLDASAAATPGPSNANRTAFAVLPDPCPHEIPPPDRPWPRAVSSSPRRVTFSPSITVRHTEANSGAAFVRKLGLKIDPTKAPKLHLFGWNIGARPGFNLETSNQGLPLPIDQITSLEHIKILAQAYFDKVDPCYGFVPKSSFFKEVENRFAPGNHSPNDSADAVIAGVAAIGCVFSQRNVTVTEVHLVCLAKSILDNYQLSGWPSLAVLTAWTLRVVYLRETDEPYATWLASCNLMHFIEASGLHQEQQSSESTSVLNTAGDLVPCDPDLRRRIVGVAHHLNAWASFDLGLTRVSFTKHEVPPPPDPREGDYTAELLALLPISILLEPGRLSDGTSDLLSTLLHILQRKHTEPPSILGQTNLVLCIIRRLHAQNNLDALTANISPLMSQEAVSNISSSSQSLADHILTLFTRALHGVHLLISQTAPWHHVANVPFQIVCVLLAMDTRPALRWLPEAMRTIKVVKDAYDTERMREAWGVVRLLVAMHQQRRREDLMVFERVLGGQADVQMQPEEMGGFGSVGATQDEAWLGALVADWPGLQGADFEQFLFADGS